MKAKELDKKFDDGDSVLAHFDMTTIRKPVLNQKRVNVDFPLWVIQSLDEESRRIGVTRQSLIKVWITERLEQQNQVPKQSHNA